MNSLQKLLTCLIFGFVAIGYGCNDDDDDPGCNWATEVQDEFDAQDAAYDAWLADPTNTAKCQAWKNSYSDYLNALEDNVECANGSGQEDELQSAIDAAQDALNQIQC